VPRRAKPLAFDNDDDSLSPAQLREIERRLKDADDPRRYIVKSVLIPRAKRPWEMFYDVSDDVWAMDIEGATLFKRKKTAMAVAALIGRSDHVRVEEVKVQGERIRRKKGKRASQTSKGEAAASRRRAPRNVQASKGRR
jgi:hypothetical protein